MKNVSKNEQFMLNQYYIDFFDPIYIKSGESSVIALSMFVSDNLSETDVKNIIHNLPNNLTLCLVNPNKENCIEYSKCITCHYELTDEDYSKEDVQFPTVI